MSSFHEWLACLVVIVQLVAIILLSNQREQMQIEAIKRGAAEWFVSENGETTFTWKPIEQ